MSERIKNFKVFQKTFAVVVGVGVCVSLFVFHNNFNSYHRNKDKYNYTVDVFYSKLTDDRVLAGEEIYLKEEEHSLYEKTIPLKLIKKIGRLSYLDKSIREADAFYEAKYSEEIALSNEASNYKLAKLELVNSFLEKHLNDKKYLTTSNVYLLESKDNFDYIKEVVYFIDTSNFEIKSMIEINSKYNHKEDILEYANYTKIDDKKVEESREISKRIIDAYNTVDSKKDVIVEAYSKTQKNRVTKMYIYDTETVILSLSDNSTAKFDISKL